MKGAVLSLVLSVAVIGCDQGSSGDSEMAAAAQAAAARAETAAAEARAQAEAAAEARAAAEEALARLEEAEATETDDGDPGLDVEEAPRDGIPNPLISCTSEANYNACLIQNLRNPATPREYEGLINAYRETGERDRACQLMRDVIDRYPTSPAARRFTQFVQRNCP